MNKDKIEVVAVKATEGDGFEYVVCDDISVEFAVEAFGEEVRPLWEAYIDTNEKLRTFIADKCDEVGFSEEAENIRI